MKRLHSLSLAGTVAALALGAPGVRAQSAPDFDRVVDRAITQENNLLAILRGEHPVVETYIQDLQPDSDFGTTPRVDHYYLGKLDLSHGVNTESFIPQGRKVKAKTLDSFSYMFSIQYVPRGFAQMLLIDGAEFDRKHYEFEYVRREFLGDVRTIVIDVKPKPEAGHGRFGGRIWVEDRAFNIVRFNGTYMHPKSGELFMHFDSWRVNAGPDLWVPFESYSEETSLAAKGGLHKMHYKAMTRVWGYTSAADRHDSEFTNLTVETAALNDSSDQAADNSPVEGLREWEHVAEQNVVDRLEKGNLVAPAGEVEKVLNTVVNNIIATNDLNITPEVNTRVLLTTPMETFAIGHTIVISRGLLDTLPDEASLAAILAHELAHIALGQQFDTKYAFNDRVNFNDEDTLKNLRFARTQEEEDAANTRAVELLAKSPYKDKLNQAGLYLKALSSEADHLPTLIKALFGSRLAGGNGVLRLSALMERAPELRTKRVDQIAALPLGARTALDPWTGQLRMARMRVTPLLSAREKMPFEISPIYLHLRYQDAATSDKNGRLLSVATPIGSANEPSPVQDAATGRPVR